MHVRSIDKKTMRYEYVIIAKPHYNSISSVVGLITFLVSECDGDGLMPMLAVVDMIEMLKIFSLQGVVQGGKFNLQEGV